MVSARLKLGGHRGFGCTDHTFFQDKRDIKNLPVENSLASIKHAFQNGADFVEIDLVMSKDKVLFALHNVVPEDHFFAKEKPPQYLNELDFSKISRYQTGRYQTGAIAKFSDILAALIRYDPHTLPWAINIEIKGVQGSHQSYEQNGFIKCIADSLATSHFPHDRILWSSFCLQNIIAASHFFPSSQFGMIFGEELEVKPIYEDHQDNSCYQYLPFQKNNLAFVLKTWAEQSNAQADLKYIHPEIMQLNGEDIDRISLLGLGINCWTYRETLDNSRTTHYYDLISRAKQKNVPFTIITDYLPEMLALNL